MIDDSGCYVPSVELRPPLQMPCEKMDICYNGPVNNTRGVPEEEGECGGDNEWEEEEDEDEEEEEVSDAVADKLGKKNGYNTDGTNNIRMTKDTAACRGVSKIAGGVSRGVSRPGLLSLTPNANGGKHFQKGKKNLSRFLLPSRIADKYGQRPRTIIRRLMLEKGLRDRSPQKAQARVRLQTLSKYRKKSVRAREWCHMREINLAFESLRNALPIGYSNTGYSDTSAAAKMTTLRLALRYITTLSQLLQDDHVSHSTDDECRCSCCSDEHSYYTTSNSSNNSGSDCNETVLYRDTNVPSHRRDLEDEDKNHFTKRSCLDCNRHALDDPLSPAYSNHCTSLNHDRYKRPRYHTEKDDSHEAVAGSGCNSLLPSKGEERRNGKQEEEEEEEEEEDDPEMYIEAIAGIFKEPCSSFPAEDSFSYQKDAYINGHKGEDHPFVGSATLPKTRPKPRVMEGHGGDPCSDDDFGDLRDYHSESHLQVLGDLKQLSEVESDALILASEAGGALSKDLSLGLHAKSLNEG